jgi:sulfofructosephosphate aldolase
LTLRYLALDHRDALRNAFARAGVDGVTAEEMTAFKLRVLDALAAYVSGVLVDEDTLRVAGGRLDGLSVLLPLEEQGHETVDGGRVNSLTPGAAPRAAGLGADGCKLLLHYRADHAEAAARQRSLVEEAATACADAGLPLVLEPLVYDEPPGERFAELVLAAACELRECGPSVLKLQYPGTAAACAELTSIADPLPWALLGGSEVDGATFAQQLEVATAAGADGFIAGRCVWGGALVDDAALERESVPLLQRLSEIAGA